MRSLLNVRYLCFCFQFQRYEDGQYKETHQHGQEMAELCSQAEEEDFISEKWKWSKGLQYILTSRVERGHFLVYTADQARFVLPLTYLENEAVAQLLNMSEEEFGLPSGGHITLPCDLGFMNYIIYQEKCSCWRSSEGVAPLNSFVLQFNFNFSLHQKN